MPSYHPPIRDMQFLLHEVFGAVATLKGLPAHAETDADTLNAVLEEGGRLRAFGIRDMCARLGLAIERSGDDPSNICIEDHRRHSEGEGLHGGCSVFADPGKCA